MYGMNNNRTFSFNRFYFLPLANNEREYVCGWNLFPSIRKSMSVSDSIELRGTFKQFPVPDTDFFKNSL